MATRPARCRQASSIAWALATATWARALSPATAPGSARASLTGRPLWSVWAWIAFTLAAEIPRAGVLMIRNSVTSSEGLAMARRKLSASLTSLRS